MIVWIDEDERYNFASRLLIERAGHSISLISNATDGYSTLLNAAQGDLKLGIVDVMLLPGDDRDRFSETNTRNGVLTGLVLIRELIENHPEIEWKKLITLYSRASDPAIVIEIENFSKEYGVSYIKKSRILTPVEFLLKLSEKFNLG